MIRWRTPQRSGTQLSKATGHGRVPNCYLVYLVALAVTVFLDAPQTATEFSSRKARAESAPPRESISERPSHWAAPVQRHGLPNLHKMSDGLYRGAQPSEAGFAQLAEMGIKTVLNLRTFHSDREQCERHGLDYVHINAQAWEIEDEEVISFLKVVTDKDRAPVFVHCQHGADRTGMMCALYRVIVQGWTREEAIREMTEGGFGFHAIWRNLINYVRDADIDALKRQAGIAATPERPGER